MPASDENDELADCNALVLAGLDSAGLDSAGLDSAGLDSAGLDSAGVGQEAGSVMDFGFASAQIDSITWQRLVSSGLPTEVYRELLVKMECQPELWRDCALAFLEEQALREAFAGIAARDFSASDFESLSASAPDEACVSDDASVSEFLLLESAIFEGDTESAVDRFSELPSLRSASRLSVNRGKNHLTRTVAIPLAAAAAGFLLAFGFFVTSGLDHLPPIASHVPGISADVDWAGEPDQVATASGSNSVDRELNDIISNLSDTDRQRLLASPSRQKIRATVPASPAIAVPGDWNSSRHFIFYQTKNNEQIVLAVDSHQYVAGEVQ